MHLVSLSFLKREKMRSLIEHGQVFSEDIAATGAKHYVVATYAGFWRMYKRLPAESKHFGEVIREGNACRLYFDIEFPIEKGEDVAAAHSTGNERWA
jgi:FAD/FMN-containing dehydrogenase